MFRSTLTALFLAAAAAGAALESRVHHCEGFDDVCGPWTLTIDKGNHSWMMGMNCTNNAGKQQWSEINLNECIGNNFGQLVSGDNFLYSCDEDILPPIRDHARNPLTLRCQDDKGGNPVSMIELHYIMCDIDGVVRCQNQYDKHLYGL